MSTTAALVSRNTLWPAQILTVGLCVAIAVFAYRYLLEIGAPPEIIAG